MKRRDPLTVRYKIYTITNKIDGMHYVGITYRSPRRRLQEHFSMRRFADGPMHRALDAHGLRAFRVVWVASAIGRKNAEHLERQMVEQLGSRFPRGYNLNDGGSGPGFHSREVKAALKLWRTA